ncbi:hypothetical protein [Pseudoduganella chitinolytica]|uniref:Plasmid stabilization protein n=1 Tax=Pseudoduganella chitinolytica TaxID=34070 RepID=A0ABY8BEY3_9BURK|nr:hypothetical protein [Pseudoduganella chitinolytica]WEF34460.1 hypothetical protein PX653_06740 [Pseudoduganella chitinolytica]
MPRGASPKREKEYEKLEKQFEKEGRYKGREEEVAARIVNKQRKEYGETKGAKAKDRAGTSPDRNVPIANYEQLTVPQVRSALAELTAAQRKKVRTYETAHKNRKGVLAALDRLH